MRRRFNLRFFGAKQKSTTLNISFSCLQKKAEKETRERNLLGSLQTSIPEQKSFLGPYCYCKHAFVQNR